MIPSSLTHVKLHCQQKPEGKRHIRYWGTKWQQLSSETMCARRQRNENGERSINLEFYIQQKYLLRTEAELKLIQTNKTRIYHQQTSTPGNAEDLRAKGKWKQMETWNYIKKWRSLVIVNMWINIRLSSRIVTTVKDNWLFKAEIKYSTFGPHSFYILMLQEDNLTARESIYVGMWISRRLGYMLL